MSLFMMTECINSWGRGLTPSPRRPWEQLQALERLLLGDEDFDDSGCTSLTKLPAEIGQLQALMPPSSKCIHIYIYIYINI